MPNRRKVLVLLLPGLGDALCASPVFGELERSDSVMHALVMLKPVRDYALDLGKFEQVHFYQMLAAPRAFLQAVRAIRRERYDAVILPFPAARWPYHILLGLSNARETVSHDYGWRSNFSKFMSPWRKHTRIALQGGHRAAENSRLLASSARPDDLRYAVPSKWRSSDRACEPVPIIGVAPGSMKYKGNETRRWPLQRFLTVANEQQSLGRHVRIFIGPNEADDRNQILAAAGPGVDIVELPLEQAAKKISECDAFVANDAGLAHVAAGLDVPTVVLFGMTNPVRATPIGPSIAVRPTTCEPCNDEGDRRFSCKKNLDYACLMRDLSVEHVNIAIENALAAPLKTETAMTGAFSLYGRKHHLA